MTMVIAHSRPDGIVWSFNGVGATFVGPAAALTDDLPSSVSAFTWLTGTQTTASVFELTGDWVTPCKPGLAGFSNLLLPVGTLVKVSWRRSTDGPGVYPLVLNSLNPGNAQRIFQGPRGERTALHLLDAHNSSNIVGVKFSIFNDVNGAPLIPAAAQWWTGEALVYQTTYLDIEAEWTATPVDTTVANYSPQRQPSIDPGLVYHQLAFRLPWDSQRNYYGHPTDPTAIDYESLMAKLDRGKTALYIPRYLDEDGTFSAHMLHRTAKLGVMSKLPAPTHRNGPYFDSSPITVMETPIPT